MKEALIGIVPERIWIADVSAEVGIGIIKKTTAKELRVQAYEIRRKELVLEAKRLFREEKLTKSEIIVKIGISYRRLRRYLAGNPHDVSKHGSRGQVKASSLY